MSKLAEFAVNMGLIKPEFVTTLPLKEQFNDINKLARMPEMLSVAEEMENVINQAEANVDATWTLYNPNNYQLNTYFPDTTEQTAAQQPGAEVKTDYDLAA
jgi:hypothetical protein